MVFLGRDVEIHCTPELARMEIGRWVHIGDGNSIRCHEGSLKIGDKTVFGCNNVVNAYLDLEIGGSTLVADWCYICDFDHKMDDITLPIKDQGIVKGPVRIGPDTWVAAKVSVLRNTVVGRGCVLGSHAVVKGDDPPTTRSPSEPPRRAWSRTAWTTGPRTPNSAPNSNAHSPTSNGRRPRRRRLRPRGGSGPSWLVACAPRT